MPALLAPYANKVAFRFAAGIIALSSALALLITVMELGLDYRRNVRQIDQQLQQIETVYLGELVENMWVADHARIDAQLAAILRLPDFVLAEVRVDGQPLLRRGEEPRDSGVRRTFELRYQHRGQWQTIGELTVVASYQQTYQMLLERVLFYLLANTAKTAVVALFIFYLYQQLIGRHLDATAQYVREQAEFPSAGPLRLPARTSAEFLDLAQAINEFREREMDLEREQRLRAEELERLAERLQRELRDRQRIQSELDLMASVFQNSSDAIMVTDARNRIIAVNKAFTRLTGYTAKEVEGFNPSLLSAGRTDTAVYRQMWAALGENGRWRGELWDRRKDGAIYPKWLSITAVHDDEGRLINYIGIFSDITEAKRAQEEIYFLAHHDTLTGLANRLGLEQQLEATLRQARRKKTEVAVMFIDLDRFKFINDVFGHSAGDLLLVEVARRLKSGVRSSDIVARLGGDEFVLVLSEIDNPTTAARVAEKLREILAEPFHIDGKSLSVTPSIGMALYPDDGDSIEILMRNADTAMYHAKTQGRNCIHFFTPGMEQAARERIQLEHDLRQALPQGQMELYYQPKVEGGNGRVVGLEALVRWHHPERGMVPPGQFIAVAEEAGLLPELGEWVMGEACRQLRTWKSQGLGPLSVAVNLSIVQLTSAGLLASVARIIDEVGIEHGELELEISESGVMRNAEACIDTLMALRNLGVRLSIDDFGTGYSSLSYLQRLPIHALKLDQAFVRDMEFEPGNATICSSTISLGHALGLMVVAEGVETEAQRRMLVDSGCDQLQGYLFSRPLPAREITAYLRGKVSAASQA